PPQAVLLRGREEFHRCRKRLNERVERVLIPADLDFRDDGPLPREQLVQPDPGGAPLAVVVGGAPGGTCGDEFVINILEVQVWVVDDLSCFLSAEQNREIATASDACDGAWGREWF